MTPDRFRLIEELYFAARERSAADRKALLANVDPDIRREVESLLDQPTGDMFFNRLAVEAAASSFEDSTMMMPASGALLGPYRIETKLGEGGMGDVYRAVDTRLNRSVAIKISRGQFSERFEREGRAISSLNHPYICTLYDVGPNYLVMELVEGETIAARVKRERLPRDTALLYAKQIAAALAEAHSKGIIHRDLKPGNIMLAKSSAKVLDFGLAKSQQDESLTVSRMVMGTPAYMAPEQREGKPADARSDIYSFGLILYEMLTGVRASQERLRLPSRALEKLVSRCLEQDPNRRWQSAAELERELHAVAGNGMPWKITIPAAAAVLALAPAVYYYLHSAPKLTEKDTIVLADFNNKTGDPVFDETLRQGMAAQLEQSPFLSMISDQRIRKMLALMKQSPDAKLTPDIAQEVCARNGSAAVLEGSLAAVGNQYVLGFRAKNCRNGEILDEEQVQVSKKEEVLNALSQIAGRFRTRVGESLAMVKKHDTPLIEATTASLDALQAYSAAQAVNVSKGSGAAVPLFMRAVELDPSFALASAHLGLAYSGIGESALAADSLKKAYEMRNHASDPEKFFISLNYQRLVTGNLEKADQVGESWAQTYPRDVRAYTQWSVISRRTGRYDRSLEESSKAIAIDPDFVFGYIGEALANLYLNRLDETEKTLLAASDRKLEPPYTPLLRYYVAFFRGDENDMKRQVTLALNRPDAEDWLAHSQALVAAYSGRLQLARGLSQRAVDLAQQAGNRERAATFEGAAAIYESLFGDESKARDRAAVALKLSQGRDVEFAVAFAQAQLGNREESQRLAGELNRRFPEDTSVQYQYLPLLCALAALKEGDPPKATQELQSAEHYELGINGLCENGFYGALYPAYVRGEVFLKEGKGVEAAAEFQKLIDHRGIMLADPTAAMARLEIGRAWRLAGDDAKAKAAYQDFLTLWKDADPDVPIIRQAKAERAKFQ